MRRVPPVTGRGGEGDSVATISAPLGAIIGLLLLGDYGAVVAAPVADYFGDAPAGLGE